MDSLLCELFLHPPLTEGGFFPLPQEAAKLPGSLLSTFLQAEQKLTLSTEGGV